VHGLGLSPARGTHWLPSASLTPADVRTTQVLRDLLPAHSGLEVRTDGDSLTAAFHNAGDAVRWACEVQEALLSHPWPARLLEHPYCAPVTVVGSTHCSGRAEARASSLHATALLTPGLGA
jgi:hypothetical protein